MAVEDQFNNEAVSILSTFCTTLPNNTKKALDGCVASIKETSDLLKLLRTVDTTDVNTFHQNDAAAHKNKNGQFLEELKTNPEILEFRKNNFNWNSEQGIYGQAVTSENGQVSIDSKTLTKLTKEYIDLLKKQAISVGFNPDEVNKVTATFSETDYLDGKGFYGEWDAGNNQISLNLYEAVDGHDYVST